MELDPTKPPGVEQAEEEEDSQSGDQSSEARKRLNTLVAITVALLVTFMAICRLKDGNIREASLSSTADQVERWAIVQAHTTRIEIANATADRFRVQGELAQPEQRDMWLKRVAEYEKLAAREAAEREQAMRGIKEDQQKNTTWLRQHEKFDLEEASLSVAIALLAITALTQIRWLYWVAMFPTAFGILMGFAGFFDWNIEPEFLARFLGA